MALIRIICIMIIVISGSILMSMAEDQLMAWSALGLAALLFGYIFYQSDSTDEEKLDHILKRD